jgi:hypothetical protein
MNDSAPVRGIARSANSDLNSGAKNNGLSSEFKASFYISW